jgi:hypothetical protein
VQCTFAPHVSPSQTLLFVIRVDHPRSVVASLRVDFAASDVNINSQYAHADGRGNLTPPFNSHAYIVNGAQNYIE